MAEQVLDKTLHAFLDELASGAPTPGGGSVAALSGAMAAGLLTMMCDLTIGRTQYADFEEDAKLLRARSETLRRELQQLAQDDVDVFGRFGAAYKLPRITQADAASRRAAIQTVAKQATEVPLRTARAVVSLLALCAPLARHGNRMAVSDVGVAVLLIQAAVPSALLNVSINLNMLEDQLFIRQVRAQIEDLTMGLDEEARGILAIVGERMRDNGK